MKKKCKSLYKDPLPTTGQINTIVNRDRAVRFRWQQHPEEMPEDIKKGIRIARDLNRRVIAEIKALASV